MAYLDKYSDNIPTGYTQAQDRSKSCFTCDAYIPGYCKMFYVPVEATAVCKEWTKNFKEES